MNWSDYFYYDETSPTYIRWKTNVYKGRPEFIAIHEGEIAGSKAYRKDGNPKRAQVQLKGKTYAIHNIIWELHGEVLPAGMVIDHKDRDPFNNNIENLSVKTCAENSRNKNMCKRNTSGVTGVSLHKRPRVSATWVDLSGKKFVKYFTIKKCGSLGDAIKVASEFRKMKIEELNILGAGYSEDHGTQQKELND